MGYILVTLLGAFLAGLLLLIQNALSKLPENLHDIKMQDKKNQNEQEMQIDNFYRQISIKELANVLEKWLEVIYDIDSFSKKIQDKNQILELYTKTTLYGSDESVRKMGIFVQYTYELNKGENGFFSDYDSAERGLIGMYLASFIVAQLKKDFTGYQIDEDFLLATKISDYRELKDVKLKKLKDKAIEFSNLY